MKILVIVFDANLKGGTEAVSREIASMLVSMGHDAKLFSIITCQDVPSLPNDISIEYSKICNSLHDKLSGHYFSDKFLRKFLSNYATEAGINLIINNTYDIAGAMPCTLPIIQVCHWSIRGYENSIMSRIDKTNGILTRIFSRLSYKLLFKRIHTSLKDINRIVALTENGKKEILSVLGLQRNISVIPNSLPYKAPCPNPSTLKNKNIIFAGRLSHEKGVIRLLRIWAKISDQLPSYTLSIYGDGYAKTEMENFIKTQSIRGVAFKGYCPDKEKIYRNADVLLMTSDNEGFGLVLLEAMHFGVPCASFKCPVAPEEIIKDAGVLVNCFDEESFSQKVVEMLKDQELLHRCQKKSMAYASMYYTQNVCTQWNHLVKSTIFV